MQHAASTAMIELPPCVIHGPERPGGQLTSGNLRLFVPLGVRAPSNAHGAALFRNLADVGLKHIQVHNERGRVNVGLGGPGRQLSK